MTLTCHKSAWSYVVSVISMYLEPLKKNVAGERLATDPDGKQAATWLMKLATDFLKARIQNLVPWRDRCFNMNGRSVEVWCVPCPRSRSRRSPINTFGIRGFVAVFCKLFYNSEFNEFRMLPSATVCSGHHLIFFWIIDINDIFVKIIFSACKYISLVP